MTVNFEAADTSREARARPARQASLREHNLRLVLRHIAHGCGTPSRADIAHSSGLTRATVSTLVDQLTAAGLVSELPSTRSSKAGRPAAPLIIAEATMAAVGVEINVDYLGVRALDLGGRLLVERFAPGDYRRSDPARVLADVGVLHAETMAALAPASLPVVGICVALPGLVDAWTGPLRVAPNLGWREVDVVSLLREHLETDRIPIRLANEAKLAARSELDVLRSSGVSSFLYLSGEVGIGGAIVRDGMLAEGGHGWNGEIGHTLVDSAGPACGCGAYGCLEQFAGQDALLEQAGLDRRRPIADLVSLAAAGSPQAIQSLERAGSALGVALSNAINLIDIDRVVLGGIFAPLARYLIPPIANQLRRRVLWQSWVSVELQAAAAGGYPALTGAGLFILESVLGQPAAWMDSTSSAGESVVQSSILI